MIVSLKTSVVNVLLRCLVVSSLVIQKLLPNTEHIVRTCIGWLVRLSCTCGGAFAVIIGTCKWTKSASHIAYQPCTRFLTTDALNISVFGCLPADHHKEFSSRHSNGMVVPGELQLNRNNDHLRATASEWSLRSYLQ